MTDLTTVAAVRAYAGLTTSDIDDATLGAVITRASGVVRGYCSRDITTGTYTEHFDGHGTRVQVLKQYPVTGVSSVIINSTIIPVISGTSPGYRFSDYAVIVDGYLFYSGLQNCTVSYTAGVDTVPADIEQATILCVVASVMSRSRDPSIRSENDQAALYSATYATGAITLPEQAKAILNQSPFRRVFG